MLQNEEIDPEFWNIILTHRLSLYDRLTSKSFEGDIFEGTFRRIEKYLRISIYKQCSHFRAYQMENISESYHEIIQTIMATTTTDEVVDVETNIEYIETLDEIENIVSTFLESIDSDDSKQDIDDEMVDR